MSRISYKKIFLWLLLFIFTCHKDDPPPPDTSLAVNLTASSSELLLGEPLIVSVEVKNADSLFALSFALHYGSALFETDTIIAGDLFKDPYLPSNPDFLSDGEVPVVIGEDIDFIQKLSSGTACSIILKSERTGTDLLYIHSLHMIKKDGTFIDGFNTLSVEFIEIQILD